MPSSRSGVRESVSQIQAEIEAAIRKSASAQAEIRAGTELEAEKVAATARDLAPVGEGDYRDSIHVEKGFSTTDDGMPVKRVISRDWKAHFIEYGTGADTEDGSRFGKDTPTPEFAVFARAAAMHGGTTGEVQQTGRRGRRIR